MLATVFTPFNSNPRCASMILPFACIFILCACHAVAAEQEGGNPIVIAPGGAGYGQHFSRKGTGDGAERLSSGHGNLKNNEAQDMAISEQLRKQTREVNNSLAQPDTDHQVVTLEDITRSEALVRGSDVAAEMNKFTKSAGSSDIGASLRHENQPQQNVLPLMR